LNNASNLVRNRIAQAQLAMLNGHSTDGNKSNTAGSPDVVCSISNEDCVADGVEVNVVGHVPEVVETSGKRTTATIGLQSWSGTAWRTNRNNESGGSCGHVNVFRHAECQCDSGTRATQGTIWSITSQLHAGDIGRRSICNINSPDNTNSSDQRMAMAIKSHQHSGRFNLPMVMMFGELAVLQFPAASDTLMKYPNVVKLASKGTVHLYE